MDDGVEERQIDPEELREAMAEFGLSDGYTHADIMASYRRLTRRYHPDLAKGEDDKDERNRAMKRVNSACKMLLASLSMRADASTRMSNQQDAVVSRKPASSDVFHSAPSYGEPSGWQHAASDDEEEAGEGDASNDGIPSGDDIANMPLRDIGFVEWLHMTAKRWEDGNIDTDTFVVVTMVMEAVGLVIGLVLSLGGFSHAVGDALVVLSLLNFFTNSIGLLFAVKLAGYALSFFATVLDGIAFVFGHAKRSCEE